MFRNKKSNKHKKLNKIKRIHQVNQDPKLSHKKNNLREQLM